MQATRCGRCRLQGRYGATQKRLCGYAHGWGSVPVFHRRRQLCVRQRVTNTCHSSRRPPPPPLTLPPPTLPRRLLPPATTYYTHDCILTHSPAASTTTLATPPPPTAPLSAARPAAPLAGEEKNHSPYLQPRALPLARRAPLAQREPPMTARAAC